MHGQSAAEDHERVLKSGAAYPFQVTIEGDDAHAASRLVRIVGASPSGARIAREYRLSSTGHADYLDMFEKMAGDFGTRLPASRREPVLPPQDGVLRPLLTAPVSPEILYGYGDPSVLRLVEAEGPAWYLLVTSNDAPDAFPILRSEDLETWRLASFVFPQGRAPPWCLTGPGLADFWAAEMHEVGGAYWVVFAARRRDHSLAIGLAKSTTPAGPFEAQPEPLLTGGVIDPHLLVTEDGRAMLLWKEDDNDLWPPLLAEMLEQRRDLIPLLFPAAEDGRTASVLASLWPWIRTLEPMERFFLLQPLIEAATSRFTAFREGLHRLAGRGESEAAAQIRAILSALKTRIYAQELSPDGERLIGDPALVLENDQPWEAHLIEGVWAVRQDGRYYLIYAGNDFSTPDYAIGAAVAERPLGPYRKFAQPVVRSNQSWWGPGHPSVALGPDGRQHMFLHAFFPGEAGYKAFRALLTAPITFGADGVRLG